MIAHWLCFYKLTQYENVCYYLLFPRVLVFHCWATRATVAIKLQCRAEKKKQSKTAWKWKKSAPYPWMGQEFFPKKNQNNAPGHLHQDVMMLDVMMVLPLTVCISIFFRICWLTSKWEYSWRCCACKHVFLEYCLHQIMDLRWSIRCM